MEIDKEESFLYEDVILIDSGSSLIYFPKQNFYQLLDYLIKDKHLKCMEEHTHVYCECGYTFA